MTINFLEILKTKQNYNLHNLKRYLKFIESIKPKPDGEYVEEHHILPKASDMFPEYSDFNQHPWNRVVLSGREHIIAHIMLWRTFPKSQSCTAALHYFFNVQNAELNIKLSGRLIPKSFKTRYAARLKEEYYHQRLGYGCFKNAEGETFFLHRDDPVIKSESLVGNKQGLTMNEDTRESMRRSKDYMRVANLRFLSFSTTVPYQSELFDEYLSQGWTIGLSDDDREHNKNICYNTVSTKLKGRADYMFPDGTFAGKLHSDDPRIESEGLVYHKTEARLNSALASQKLTIEVNTGTLWYNNGTINKKFKTEPGSEWVLGQLVDDSLKAARTAKSNAATSGKKTYNDGVKNFFVGSDDYIDPTWIKGMKPQKKRELSLTQSGYLVYNDGVKSFKVYDGNFIDPSWTKGMLPRRKG